MKLNVIGQNQSEIIFNSGDRILFSYNTPVAACINEINYQTEEKYSKTTAKHISTYFKGAWGVFVKPQSFFNNLIEFI
ncbi:MAG: hypothetical protein ACOCQD_03180 [archaeon]